MTKSEPPERYHELFDFAPVGYAVLVDIDEIVEINHHGAELLGYGQSLLVGRRFAELVSPSLAARYHEILRAAHSERVPISGELELVRGTTAFAVRLHATTLQRERPTMLVAFEDISERKAKDVELGRTEHALREQARRKDEFLAILSHELRNPLAPIRTSVASLELMNLPLAEARQSIEIIRSSSDHLARLVDDLLDVTRITTGRIVLQRQRVDLCELARRAIAEHKAEAASYRVEIETHICDDPVWLDGDPVRLAQIFSNLLGNAMKFTPAGGKITVSAEQSGARAAVHILDTGVGIAPEMLGQLAQPFVQAPQALDRSPGGLGLGLAMARSLVELHGGTFEIRSAGIGLGTEIALTFPAIEGPRASAPRIAAPPVPPRRVLVIEDNHDVARSLVQLLSLRGHTVEVAFDATSGIARALDFVPELVLCDVGLPDIDGYEVARQLRGAAAAKDMSLVAMTGYAGPDDRTRALEAGFDAHLAKPASVQALDRMLRTLPRHH